MSGIISQNAGRTSGLVKAAAAAGGVWTLIKTITASGDSDIAFVDGSSDVVLDSTYPIYCFRLINIHPSEDDKTFLFNGSDDTTSHTYDITKTTTFWSAYHEEGGTTGMGYSTSADLAESGNYQRLFDGLGTDNDQSLSGELWLYNPSSTTYVKHFKGHLIGNRYNDTASNTYYAGYFNTTAAITAINFNHSSGDTDAGKIKLYGMGDS